MSTTQQKIEKLDKIYDWGLFLKTPVTTDEDPFVFLSKKMVELAKILEIETS